jgi:membrane protease YdiL (CAAX protease family)
VWLVFAICYIFLSVLVGLSIKLWPMPLWSAAALTHDVKYIFVFKIAFLLLVSLAIFRSQGYTLSDLQFDWTIHPLYKRLSMLGLAFAAGFVLNIGQIRLIREAVVHFPVWEASARIALGVTLPLLMAALPEEVVFRGILHTRLEALWGRLPAVAATALLFTAWHIPTRYFVSTGVEGQAGDLLSVLQHTGAPVLLVGIVFSFFWDRYRNLWALILAHWAIDLLPSVCSMLQIQR